MYSVVSLFQQNRNFERPKMLNLLLEWVGLSISLKGCKFKHTELSIHFEPFNDECAIVEEPEDANQLIQESKLTRVNVQLNWCPSKSTTPALKRIHFQYLKVNLQPLFLGHTTSWSEYDMQYHVSRWHSQGL